MIDLGRSPLQGEGVTIFADHADAKRFHYLPDAPRLRRRDDGSPDVSLLKYRLDPSLQEALGGGLLTLSVDLGVDEDTLSKLRARVARQFDLDGQPQLSPVVADSGTCELILIDRSSESDRAPSSGEGSDATLVERVLSAGAPTLFGDNVASFAAVLSPEGAAMVEGAMRGGGLPAGVVYRLQIAGVRPSLRASFTARWSEIYHFYENRFRGGQILLAADVGKTLEELTQSQALTVSVDALVPGEERQAVFDEVLKRAQDYVVETLFTPTLSNAPPPPDPEGGALATVGRIIKGITGVFGFTYSLRDLHRDELKTMTYSLAASQAERFTVAPQGSLALLLRDGEGDALDPDGFITVVESAASMEMSFDVGASVDLAAEGIDLVEVTLSYGDRDATVRLTPASPRGAARFWFREELGASVRYRFAVSFSAGAGLFAADPSAGPVRSEARPASSRVIRVDPRELYERHDVKVVAQGLPLQRYPIALVDLRADASEGDHSETATVALDARHGEAVWTLRVLRGVSLAMQSRVHYIDVGGAETVTAWEPIGDGYVIVGDPYPAVLDVQVLASARFGAVVSRLIVELRPLGDTARVESRTLSAAQPAVTWSCRLEDATRREYEYRVTVHTARGEVRTGEWKRGSDPVLVVGEGFDQLRQVQVQLLGRSFADLKLLGVKVRFWYEDRAAGLFAEDEVLAQDSREPLRFTYPVADLDRRAFTYQLTLIGADGESRALDPVTTTDKLVIVPLR